MSKITKGPVTRSALARLRCRQFSPLSRQRGGALEGPNYETKPNLALLSSQWEALKGSNYETKPNVPLVPSQWGSTARAQLPNEANFFAAGELSVGR